MSRMSEVHQDLESIHQILLGQRKVAQDLADKHEHWNDVECCRWKEQVARVQCIDDLLLEFEAAGVVWPDNVVELNTVTPPCGFCKAPSGKCCDCGGDIHPEHGPNC